MTEKKKNQQNLDKQQHESDDDSEHEEGSTCINGIYIPPPIKPHCSMEAGGPRLMITRIENENFKSYAGIVHLGPFHHRFSAIIGPNGSGKSNVIDAMLFVFGYRAQRIRSKKISVLLHNSASHPSVNSCRVSVHFVQIVDNPDGSYTEVPDSKLVISRSAFKDNSSFYTINGKRCQFKEVAELLKRHGIDLDHNRFLILQGEVESIAMMKPKVLNENETGLLEYMEDIIGTNRYKKPLFQLNQYVENLNVERTEKHNRCKLAEREMKDLQKPMADAVKFLELENDLFRLQNLQAQKYISVYKNQIADGEEKLATASEKLKAHDDKFNELVIERDRLDNEIKKQTAEKDSVAKQEEKLKHEIQNREKSQTNLQETMKATNNQRKQIKANLEKEKTKLENLKQQPAKMEKELKESEIKLKQLKEQKMKIEVVLQKNLLEFRNETKALREKKEVLETELIKLKEKEGNIKSELDLAESELQICKDEEILEARKTNTLEQSFEETKLSLEEKKKEILEFEKTLQNQTNTLQNYINNCHRKKQEEQNLTEKIKVLRTKVVESRNVLQARHKGKVYEFLMKLKSDGKLPGIFGRLGDLGGIDSKYDVAISTACPTLDHILVDTVDTAEACIEYLKKSNVGRARFIALEKMEQYKAQAKSKINTPNRSFRLFDLIRVEDERVCPAFYFALRDTLVCENLEEATKIAYGAKRWRVVTLKGEVIEMAGTMSGGGKTMIQGKMGLKVQTKTTEVSTISNEQMNQMSIDLEKTQTRLNLVQEEQGHLEMDIYKLEDNIKRTKSNAKKLEQDIRILTETIPKLAESLEKQRQKAKNVVADQKKVKELEAKIKPQAVAFKKISEQVTSLQNEKDMVENALQELQKEKINDIKSKVTNIDNQMKKLTTNINKINVEMKSFVRSEERISTIIENMQADIKECEQKIKACDEERKENDEKLDGLTAEIETFKNELTKLLESLKMLKKERSGLSKSEHEAQLQRQELEESVQNIQTQIIECKNKIPHWEKQIVSITLHQIPNREIPEKLKEYDDQELKKQSLKEIQYQVTDLEEKLQKKPNLKVIDEFMKKRENYLQKIKLFKDITAKRSEMRQKYEDIRKLRFSEFMQGFTIINRKLKQMYQMITLGGDAELDLVDSMDPFNEGIVFSVRPPKKSWKQISNLSGGEKTLSSLALVFALHYYKPSPLYVMDEIDAALDFKNVSIVANYIKERTKNAQFIIISLRSNMFELSDNLVGICKYNDCTKSATIENNQGRLNRTIDDITETEPI